MAWRNVFIRQKAHLSLHLNNLVVSLDEDYRVPIEDIATIMIENRYVTMTAALISKLMDHHIVVYTVDEKYLPNGVMLPINQHSRHLKMIKYQLKSTKPFYKNIWQLIIRSKIQNQGIVLKAINHEEYSTLEYYAKLVKSGDSDNMESVAAAFYFKRLFSKDFTRREENTINSCLNYGYAIIRGAIARYVSVYGFLPTLGIYHDAELNQFNLVDDIFEPYRQVVDLWVYNNVNFEDELSPELKLELYNLLNYKIRIKNQNHSVLNAIDLTVQSLSSAFRLNNPSLIKLPTLLKELELYQYE